MTEQIIDPTPSLRQAQDKQFSDLATGDTCWVVITGQAVQVEKLGFQTGRKTDGRRGKTWISPNRLVYDTKEDAAASLEKLLDYGRRIREQRAFLAGGAA